MQDRNHRHQTQRGSVEMDPSDMKIGKIGLKIYQGDITMAKTDAIINSSNAEIDLSRVKKMKKDGIAVTSSGKGTMPCKHIIHINAENSKTWESRILESLQKADKYKLSSVAFPALGTGQGMNF
ncbi:hypothetical protein KUTeg_005550 [Tegillarca granosa]|uniref:Macro domain-containing protein n=1 Tax=Tegillarca granosa TaxID=220873 RepID=A0ABQ9FK26_TEGGR|nr:hypothetical protein KUTeg_005550 [Tegillarca granosa]